MKLLQRIFKLGQYEDPVLEIRTGTDNTILKSSLWNFIWHYWYHHVRIKEPETVTVWLNGKQIKAPEGVFGK